MLKKACWLHCGDLGDRAADCLNILILVETIIMSQELMPEFVVTVRFLRGVESLRSLGILSHFLSYVVGFTLSSIFHLLLVLEEWEIYLF